MRSTSWTPWSITLLTLVSCITNGSHAEPAGKTGNGLNKTDNPGISQKVEEKKRRTIKTAREQAKLAHNIFSATLDVIHHHYFRDDRSVVPARSMEDLFSRIAHQENIQARWIAVNTRAMSIDHRPKDDFERQAAKLIAAGKRDYELVQDGVYRRAQGISLMNKGCLNCHVGFTVPGKSERFAGLVITIPLTKD